MPEVRLENSGRIAIISIDRPRRSNAIGLATIDELRLTLDEIDRSDAAVVVLRGDGDRVFISGGDLKELEAVRTENEAAEMAARMRSVLDRFATFPVPVIAAMNGHALGGGAEVCLAADIRLAAGDIKVGFSQSTLGIMPAWGGVERLVELIGRSQAMLLIATGRILTAHEARSIGLVDDVVDRADFEDAWHALAEQFARLPGPATRLIKSVVAATRPNVHPNSQQLAISAFAHLWAADAHWEAAAASQALRRAATDRSPSRSPI